MDARLLVNIFFGSKVTVLRANEVREARMTCHKVIPDGVRSAKGVVVALHCAERSMLLVAWFYKREKIKK